MNMKMKDKNIISIHSTLQQQANALVPVLKERAAQAEKMRQVPPDSVQDLLNSGLVHVATPKRFGGAGLEVDTQFAISWELGRGCGSTAWCYAVWAAHNSWLSYYPERCQEEYFATGSSRLISSGLNPHNGTAKRVNGGFRVSGRWPYSSGCDAASWVIVGCDTGSNNIRWLLLPRDDYDIVDDTWFVSGLQGTGSKDIVVSDVFVPEYRTIDPNHTGDNGSVPVRMLTVWALSAPLIGMAQGVVDEFTSRAAHSVPLQHRLAEASAEVDTARMLHHTNVREILDRTSQGSPFTPLERARYQRDGSFAVKLCVQAVNRLYESSGTQAIMASEPIQRLYRDVHAGSLHYSLNWDAFAGKFSRLTLGLDDE